MKIDIAKELALAYFEAESKGIVSSDLKGAIPAIIRGDASEDEKQRMFAASITLQCGLIKQYAGAISDSVRGKRYADAMKNIANTKKHINECSVLIRGLPYDLPSGKVLRIANAVTAKELHSQFRTLRNTLGFSGINLGHTPEKAALKSLAKEYDRAVFTMDFKKQEVMKIIEKSYEVEAPKLIPPMMADLTCMSQACDTAARAIGVLQRMR